MPSVSVIIPYRDRGTDPLRQANLDRVLQHWADYHTPVTVVSDDRTGPFNRSHAYNRAIQASTADILVLTEADMLIDYEQIDHGIHHAAAQPGVVIPFTERHELNPTDSQQVRDGADQHQYTGEVFKAPRRIGAINIISRETYNAVGQYDPTFTGSHWDDRSMELAFHICAGPTRWVDANNHAITKTELKHGVRPTPARAYHLHHDYGWKGPHLTPEDRAATNRNQLRFQKYRQAKTAEQMRQLTTGLS